MDPFLLVWVYGSVFFLLALVGTLSAFTDVDPEMAKIGSRVALCSPVWPVALVLLLVGLIVAALQTMVVQAFDLKWRKWL